MSRITTHILDTSKGKPAAGVKIILSKKENEEWQPIGSGVTNNDGRVPDLLQNGVVLEKGLYRLKFATKEYFDKDDRETFYPYVEIIFEIKNNEYYHVPLLINPFGYSTYRGS